MTEVKIEGVDNALKVLEAYPINAHKVIDKAIRKAGTQAVKEVRSAVPHKDWRKMAKGRLKSYKEGGSYFKFGLYGDKSSADGKITNWFKAYWKNHGTLARRDPNHHFDYKRKRVSANWKGGIRPSNFFEPSAERALKIFADKFEQELNKRANEILTSKQTNGRTTTTEIR